MQEMTTVVKSTRKLATVERDLVRTQERLKSVSARFQEADREYRNAADRDPQDAQLEQMRAARDELSRKIEARRSQLLQPLRESRDQLATMQKDLNQRVRLLTIELSARKWEGHTPTTEDEFSAWWSEVGHNMIPDFAERFHADGTRTSAREWGQYDVLIPGQIPNATLFGILLRWDRGRVYAAFHEGTLLGLLYLRPTDGNSRSEFLAEGYVRGKLLVKDVVRVSAKNMNPSEAWTKAIREALGQAPPA